MTWVPATTLSRLQLAGRETAILNGHKILLIWHEGEVYATQAQCPHLGLPLLKGKINNDCHLVCPFHKSAFDLKTGDVECWSPWPPVVGTLLGKVSKPKNLHIYPVRIDGDEIEVQLPVSS